MSLLAPLYFLGALAISLPILFHLIRRTPRGRQPFSSLMFLSPTPPRITRRSRIEHWLLLLMRAAVLLLLALAFSRPFLRESASRMLEDSVGGRWAILVDTSASMRRGDLWRRAVQRAEQVVSQLGPADEVALFAFDEQLRPVIDWDEPIRDPKARAARFQQGLAQLAPTWGTTRLGTALTGIVDRLLAASAGKSDHRPFHVVLISDLQKGSDITSLQSYEWPRQIQLTVEQIHAPHSDNASLHMMPATDQPGWRVRVTSTPGATTEQYQIGWLRDDGAKSAASELTVHVPAGSTRVVSLPEPPAGAYGVSLTGDADDFDNVNYFAARTAREIRILVLGNDLPNDPQGLTFFLERVWSDTAYRKIQMTCRKPGDAWHWASDRPPHLVAVLCPLPESQAETLASFIQSGGMALLVAADQESAASLAAMVPGVRLAADSSSPRTPQQYALLETIDFDHPVFASLAGARYNDFTRLRFWNHPRFAVDESANARVLARFDNGDPAIWEQTAGEGKVAWIASGWRPNESQLALSSKFVPILSGMLDHLAGVKRFEGPGSTVSQPVSLPEVADGFPADVTKPDGQKVRLDVDTSKFTGTDQPGIYRWQGGAATWEFAVNLAAAESNTAPMSIEELEQLGVRTGRERTHREKVERQRQLRDIELESRQKLWRWLLFAVLGFIGIETILAGRSARREKESP